MKHSLLIIEFIKKVEGFESLAYRPFKSDKLTIGYGFTYVFGKPVIEYQSITEVIANQVLENLLCKIDEQLNKSLNAAISQNEYDAVVSLVYNVGAFKFLNSNTGEKFCRGENISAKFPLWVYFKGRVEKGLINRRKQERKIYDNGDYEF